VETKTCYVCGRFINARNEIGLNRKLLGREITKFYCYGCLAEQMEIEVYDLMAKIEDFKNQGCALFE
jgi:hypothetical protein